MNPPALESPLYLEQPLEIDEARRASHAMAVQRRAAEKHHATLVDKAAGAERDYRLELAKAFVTATGKTAAEKEANARAMAADAAYKRDLAAGMLKAQVEVLRGLEGERSQLKTLQEWSMRMRLDGPSPDNGSVIGGRK